MGVDRGCPLFIDKGGKAFRLYRPRWRAVCISAPLLFLPFARQLFYAVLISCICDRASWSRDTLLLRS